MRNTWLNTLYKISHKNPKTIFIGSDLGANVMNDFKNLFQIDSLWRVFQSNISLA